jgi:hypothetical protein
MRLLLPWRRAWCLIVVAASLSGLASAARGQDDPDDANAQGGDDVAAIEAEIERLTAEVAQRQERLAELKRRASELRAAGAGEPEAAAGDAPRRVAYVLDLSGSMVEKWPLVREEVTKAVGNLAADSTFDVVLGAEEVVEHFHPEPVAPTPEALAALHQFLQGRRTEGPTGMIAPMEAALANEPDVIWLVTDGDMPNNKLFRERVRKANPGGRTRVNVVVATEGRRLPDVDRIDMVRFLQAVAAENGGKLYGMNGDVVNLDALPDWVPQPVGGWRDDAPPRFNPNKIPRGRTVFQE